jgi:hypothetical protein
MRTLMQLKPENFYRHHLLIRVLAPQQRVRLLLVVKGLKTVVTPLAEKTEIPSRGSYRLTHRVSTIKIILEEQD